MKGTLIFAITMTCTTLFVLGFKFLCSLFTLEFYIYELSNVGHIHLNILKRLGMCGKF